MGNPPNYHTFAACLIPPKWVPVSCPHKLAPQVFFATQQLNRFRQLLCSTFHYGLLSHLRVVFFGGVEPCGSAACLAFLHRVVLLMVQKIRRSPVDVVDIQWYPNINKALAPSQVVVWDFWAINNRPCVFSWNPPKPWHLQWFQRSNFQGSPPTKTLQILWNQISRDNSSFL